MFPMLQRILVASLALFALVCLALPAPAQEVPKGPRKFVLALAADARGDIWLGCEDEGVYRCHPLPDGQEFGTWEQFTTKDGLGDDNAYALAIDALGRVWAGHLSHGVSVFDGKSWKNFDTTTGPLGGRVFAIATCPTDGDVWMATDSGLARYSLHNDTWTYYTRADGLVSDQASALAFDKTGRIYVGTHCDGIAIADPADDYKKWTTIDGPARMPLAGAGKGLPSCMINTLLYTRRGVLLAGTPWGLGKSTDKGQTWTFMRGQELPAKMKGLANPGPEPDEETLLLAEDYVTTLAEDGDSRVWIGFRRKGYQVYNPERNRMLTSWSGEPGNEKWVTCILPRSEDTTLIARYVGSMEEGAKTGKKPAPAELGPLNKEPPTADAPAPMPKPAPAPTAAQLAALAARVKALPAMKENAVYLGEDWATQGNWIGRYGHTFMESAAEGTFVSCPGITVESFSGPHHEGYGGVYSYTHWIKTENRRVLYAPMYGTRRQGEWNDGSFEPKTYSFNYDGPDLWIKTTLPEGVFKLTFYFYNKDGHGGWNGYRDFLLELKTDRAQANAVEAEPGRAEPGPVVEDAKAEAFELPTVARARVRDFWGGVHKTFLVQGGRNWYLRVARNYSFCTIASGVLVDQVAGKEVHSSSVFGLGKAYKIPAIPDDLAIADPQVAQRVGAARDLWSTLDGAYQNLGSAILQRTARLQAYRTAVANHVSETMQTNWRWKLGIWTDSDDRDFNAAMLQAWQAQKAANPGMGNEGAVGPGEEKDN